MKSNFGTNLVSINKNKDILFLLKTGKHVNTPFLTIWLGYDKKLTNCYYALLVNKSQFKLSVTRNKIKRQLRNILVSSSVKKGTKILIKPNSLFLKKEFAFIKQTILNIINNYQNGK